VKPVSIHYQTREFEGGVKLRWEVIGPDLEVFDLWLPDWQEWRFVGKLDPYAGILFCKRMSRHKHEILNSWGISAYLIQALEERGLKLIVLDVEDTKERFEITLEKLRIEAVWKWWKEGGFDRQAFVPITLWDKKK
jgi:hypothetical protein